MAEKRNPLGPTGETVRSNLQRLREAQNLGYTKLARILEEIGRPIPELGLRRIESGDRRVDADDLVALAVALGVSPITLLMPEADKKDSPVTITGEELELHASRVWTWLSGEDTLPQAPTQVELMGLFTRTMFGAYAWPVWVQEEQQRRSRARLDEILGETGVESRGND
jgi:transcriptional regulator with XRE-family HTH domain